MSPSFILAIKKQFKCLLCGHQKLIGYSCCSKHLVYARRKWREHTAKRYAAGQCAYCSLRHVPGEQRCRKHKEINRVRIHKWAQAKYYSRKRDGLCVDCLIGQATPAIPGTIRCETHTEAGKARNRAWRLANR